MSARRRRAERARVGEERARVGAGGGLQHRVQQRDGVAAVFLGGALQRREEAGPPAAPEAQRHRGRAVGARGGEPVRGVYRGLGPLRPAVGAAVEDRLARFHLLGIAIRERADLLQAPRDVLVQRVQDLLGLAAADAAGLVSVPHELLQVLRDCLAPAGEEHLCEHPLVHALLLLHGHFDGLVDGALGLQDDPGQLVLGVPIVELAVAVEILRHVHLCLQVGAHEAHQRGDPVHADGHVLRDVRINAQLRVEEAEYPEEP
mmetsp:Transcript_41324/g.107575  ORF Transcript_41324/g.107575 Transcript_41324/m.107575 type:complete len:260 (+) Transcript_41324:10-789(+)